MSETAKKVYDYDASRVRDRLVDAFRKGKGEATTADLVALTGLPKAQVDAEVKAVSDEYGARLRVTESGEILYSFPRGMRSRYRGLGPSFRRGWKAFKKGAAAVLSYLFKAWIVVMLVGYFVLFLALAVVAMLASVAGSGSGNSRDSRSSRGGGIGGIWLTGRLLDSIVRIWFYSELFMTPEQRARRDTRRREKRPLYKAIFSFVFGDGDPDAGWDTVEKKAFVAFVQANRGVITMPEFLALTGLRPLEAEEGINRYLYEFEGSPEVTEGGAIYYFFPGLLRRKDRVDRTYGSTTPMRRIAPFSANPKKANVTFCLINAANLLFGAYFFFQSFAPHARLAAIYSGRLANQLYPAGGGDGFYLIVHQLFGKFANVADPAALIAIALGAVPLAFSAFFYLIPAIRARRLAARNERARVENLRRVAYRAALDSPESLRPESIAVADDAARPRDGRAAARALTDLAAWSQAEPRSDGSFSFGELARVKAEAAKLRSSIDLSKYELGGEAFDSDSRAD
jgi:hypothetical protein